MPQVTLTYDPDTLPDFLDQISPLFYPFYADLLRDVILRALEGHGVDSEFEIEIGGHFDGRGARMQLEINLANCELTFIAPDTLSQLLQAKIDGFEG